MRQARKAQKPKEREQGDEGRERVGRATNLPERKRKERREAAANKNRENKNNKRIGITPPISQEGEDLDEGGSTQPPVYREDDELEVTEMSADDSDSSGEKEWEGDKYAPKLKPIPEQQQKIENNPLLVDHRFNE